MRASPYSKWRRFSACVFGCCAPRGRRSWMFFSRKRYARGSLLEGLGLLVIVGLIGGFLGSMTVMYSRTAKKKIQDMRGIVTQTSSIELVMFAYRSAEYAYISAVAAAP